jgi:enoyl-CoA hydratase
MSDRYGLKTIKTELVDDVLVVTLNRPERRNALSPEMHLELHKLYEAVIHDDEPNAMVLTGEGKYFCVGADFADMESNLEGGGYPDGHPGLLIESVAMARNILAVRIPMVAAINGDAIGIGATISLFCDVVYMAETARIADPHVKGGMVAGDGGAVLWPLLMGPNRAKEFLMTGDLVTAQDADRLGLVNHVVPTESVFDEAMAMAKRLAAAPALPVRLNKRLVNKELETRVVQLYDLSVAFEALTLESADHREAVSSFLEKRPAVFRSGKFGGS